MRSKKFNPMQNNQNVFKSPFSYVHPETLNAKDANYLFVDYFDYFDYISDKVNTFIHGPRGSGKSMLFRMLKPDCQKLKNNKIFKELDFIGVHIPIKHSDPQISDIETINIKTNQGVYYVNEHILVIHILFWVFKTLSDENFENNEINISEANNFFKNTFLRRLKSLGWEPSIPIELKDYNNISSLFKDINDLYLMDIKDIIQTNFLVKSSMAGGEPVQYNGPICLYSNFLLPIIKKLKELSFIPQAPFYFLIDDADWLNDYHKEILNTWISYRDGNNICFKISTQFRYYTYYTTNGNRIENPHDYIKIDLTENYTSDTKGRYLTNLKNIVEKRLNFYYDKDFSAYDFFPEDKEQEIEIEKIFNSFKENYNYDYAYRYARLEYMHSLEKLAYEAFLETSNDVKEDFSDWQISEARKVFMKEMKNKYSYNYAGFKQLTNISSGIIRNFLDPANNMWQETKKIKQTNDFSFIPTDIQNNEIRSYSNEFYLGDFESEKSDKNCTTDKLELLCGLENLIKSIGSIFRYILLSDMSERRVFAFFFENEPEIKVKKEKLNEVIKLAIHKGYLLKATKGSKTGIGNVRMYVLNRMLSPFFDLDPNSFSGYKYISANWLVEAIENPDSFIKKYKSGKYKEETGPNLFSNIDN